MFGLSPTMIAVALGVMLLLTIGSAVLVQGRVGSRARLRKRIDSVVGRPGQATARGKGAGQNRRKAIQNKLKELEDSRKRKETGKGIAATLEQAGMSTKPKAFYVYSALFGIICTAIYVGMGYKLWGAIPVFIFTTIGLPRWFIRKRAARRMNRFTKDFADAIDVIVRGIRSGLPVGECMNMIGREMPDPVGMEFRQIVEGQRLGMSLEEVLERGISRVPTAEFRFFAIVLTIQQQTGGNLADTLAKLSDVLRGRKKLKDKIKALSSEAKASAGIIGSLPFLMALLLFLVKRDYIMVLFTDPTGQYLAIGGIVWMTMGILVMRKMINFEI